MQIRYLIGKYIQALTQIVSEMLYKLNYIMLLYRQISNVEGIQIMK